MNLPKLILASASPRRADLLRELGLEFEIITGKVEEAHREQLTAAELCQINAYRKARVVAKRFPTALVLGADTLVAKGHKIYAKPGSMKEAQKMLEELQGDVHQVVTGVCLIHLQGHRYRIFADTTDVTMRKLSAQKIREYHKICDPLDKAGAYGIQQHGDMIVEKVLGSYSNVVGLPLERLQIELKEFETESAGKD
jgi:septum formation protein